MSERYDNKSAIDRTLFGNYQPGRMIDGKWVPEQARSSEVSSSDTDLALADRTGCLSFTNAKRLTVLVLASPVILPALFTLGIIGAIADGAMSKEESDY